MPDLILRLRVDPVTGRREVVVDYSSDADALPMEHEEAHRQLAGGVVDGGLASPRVEVRRDAEPPGAEAAPAKPAVESAAPREPTRT